MCLALIAIDQHPRYPLIILSNRDEFYNRATIPAHYWPENPDIFAGKDRVGGGSWLGVNTKGHFSLVTNYRNPTAYDALKKSRGMLVTNFLNQNNLSPSAYIDSIAAFSDTWNPFNLIVGNNSDIEYYSNMTNKTVTLTTGLHGISNHLLNTPWHKVVKARHLFLTLLDVLKTQEDPITIRELLFPVLADKTPTPDNLLPETGIPFELEKALGSIFVNILDYNYGTRSSTIILITKNNLSFCEKTFMNGKAISMQETTIAR